MQIIHDDSAESGEPKLGDKECTAPIYGTEILFNTPNKGECCRGVSNPPDNLRGRDDRSPLLSVWQELANCCRALCRKWYCFREREPPAKTATKRKYVP